MDEVLQDKTGKVLLKLNIPHDAKMIFFSDLHRGLGDLADDFTEKQQRSYHTALESYLKNDFALFHLGDIEELKEQPDVKAVLKTHQKSVLIEKEFHRRKKYFRIFGNHDSQYENPSYVDKTLNLAEFYGLDGDLKDHKVQVFQGILLQYGHLPDVLLVHGHQGYLPILTNFFEIIGLPFGRFWINNIQKKNRSVNYESYCDIEKDENAFYDWASKYKNQIVIFGHTHRPLWGGKTVIEAYEKKLKVEVDKLRNIAIEKKVSINILKQDPIGYGITEIIDNINKFVDILKKKMAENGVCRAPKPLPILYNTGCCIFEDGDITGIEIDQGFIKLVKWGLNTNNDLIERTELECEYLGALVVD